MDKWHSKTVEDAVDEIGRWSLGEYTCLYYNPNVVGRWSFGNTNDNFIGFYLVCTKEEFEAELASREDKWTHTFNGVICKILVSEPDTDRCIIVVGKRGKYYKACIDYIEPIVQITAKQTWTKVKSGETMKPTDLKCFNQVASVIGERSAVFNLQIVINTPKCYRDYRLIDFHDRQLRDAFNWELSPQGFGFWKSINKGENPITPTVTMCRAVDKSRYRVSEIELSPTGLDIAAFLDYKPCEEFLNDLDI